MAWVVAALTGMMAVACSTNLTGRKQVTLLPESTLAEMGAATFQDLRKQGSVVKAEGPNRYVRCIVDPILAVIPRDEVDAPTEWEVVVFDDPTPNAFALPGGKIGVHTGMVELAENADQLAAVIGHEIGHVLLHHGNERASQSMLTQTALQAGAIALSGMDPIQQQAIVTSLGVGAQYGILLPYSRSHESEADEVGQQLMASAGFDPEAAVDLWRNMQKQGGQAPPEFMSTHPSNQTRIAKLEENLSSVSGAYSKARASGRRPSCQL